MGVGGIERLVMTNAESLPLALNSPCFTSSVPVFVLGSLPVFLFVFVFP